MKILILTSTPRSPDNHLLWEGLRHYADVDVHFVGKDAQRNLRRVLADFDLAKYQRVIVDLLFRYVSRHAYLLGGVSGLVFYEEDACQNFIGNSAWCGAFEKFYRKLPNARLICTGNAVTQKFRADGVDANFTPKGFDSSTLSDIGGPRDIALGFIGRLGSRVYGGRKELLERAAANLGLQIIRTQPGADYCRALNRIRVFVSADVGMGEYMAKNFEAMACGCLLLAVRQGEGEEEALGLGDGDNVLLYDSYSELVEKVEWISRNERLANEIALRGRQHVVDNFDYRILSKRIYDQLVPPLPEPPPRAAWQKILSRWI